jgi:hypothetical protein
MRIVKKILLPLFAILVLLQLIRPAKNKSNAPTPGDISHVTAVPADVQAILQKACYDCHSNNTRYPWYVNIQPVGLYLAHHIEEGKDELNFNEFGAYSAKRQRSKLKGIAEQIKEGAMPLSSYTLLHKAARLTAAEQAAVIKWVATTLNENSKN